MALVTEADGRLGPRPLLHNSDPTEENATITRLEQKLEICRQRLFEAWKRFLAGLPAEQRLTVGDEPDLAYLLDSIKQATAAWDHKRKTTRTGKFKVKFESLMSRINEHRDLLSIVPSDDKYVSAIAGSLAIMAKAAVSHQNIGETVSDLLEGLHDDLDYWKRQMVVHRHNHFMQSHIMELYVIIFEMFTDIFLGWSGTTRWKRMLHSLDNVWPEKAIERRQERISQLRLSLENEAKLATEKVIHEELVKIEAIQKVATAQGQDIADLKETVSKLVHILTLQFHPPTRTDLLSISHSPQKVVTAGFDLEMDVKDYTKDLDLTFLSGLTHREEQVALIEQCQPASVTAELKSLLESWLKDSASTALWIEGPFDVELPSATTSIHVTLTGVFQSMNHPVISHICTQPDYSVPRNDRNRLGLLSLVSDLCQQCWTRCRSSKPIIHAEQWDGVLENYRLLRQSPESIPAALSLLAALLQVHRPVLICLIDNINILEDPKDKEQTELLRRFIEIFTLRYPDEQGGTGDIGGPILKLCSTTDGASSTLGTSAYEGLINRFEYLHDRNADEALSFDN